MTRDYCVGHAPNLGRDIYRVHIMYDYDGNMTMRQLMIRYFVMHMQWELLPMDVCGYVYVQKGPCEGPK